MKKYILTMMVVVMLPCMAYADNKDSSVWWIKNYGAVEATDNPMVGRAERVFERVDAVADKRGNKLPKMFVIKMKGDPWAISLPDGGIILSEGALDVCYGGVTAEEGDSRVAFIIGHELAHLAKDDFWHRESFMAFSRQYDEKKAEDRAIKALYEGATDVKKKEAAKMKELQADQNGLTYMTLAGYEPKQIMGGRNFFEEWTNQVTGRVAYEDKVHPTAKERAEFLRTQLIPVVESLDLFSFGVRLYQLGSYTDAEMFFQEYAKKFPGREVFNNIGLSHYNMALKALSGCDANMVKRFYLSTVLDVDTYGSKFASRGADTSNCMKNKEFIKHMKEALNYLEKASKMDEMSITGKINLSSALIMFGDYSKAMSEADESLKIKETPEGVNNKAVAFYLFGKANNLGEAADSALKMISEIKKKQPAFAMSYYNMGRILTELGRTASANESFNQFLNMEKTGLYADAARKTLKIETENQAIKSARMESPVKLGNATFSKEQLKKMKAKTVKIVDFDGTIYDGDNLKILVISDGKDDIVEMVEQTVEPRQFKMPTERPVRRVVTNMGETLLYENFAVDVVDNQVRKVVYFMSEM